MHILSAGPSLLIDVAERKDPVKSNANQQPIIINYCKPRANQNWLKSTADKNWQKHFTLENTFTLLKTCLSEVSPCAAAVSVDFCSCFKCEPFNFDFDLISHSIEHCRALRKSYFFKSRQIEYMASCVGQKSIMNLWTRPMSRSSRREYFVWNQTQCYWFMTNLVVLSFCKSIIFSSIVDWLWVLAVIQSYHKSLMILIELWSRKNVDILCEINWLFVWAAVLERVQGWFTHNCFPWLKLLTEENQYSEKNANYLNTVNGMNGETIS